MADIAQLSKLIECVQSPVLGWLGDIDHSRHDHVVVVGIFCICFHVTGYIRGMKFAGSGVCRMRNREHLVTAKLDCSGFMGAYVTCVRGDNALI